MSRIPALLVLACAAYAAEPIALGAIPNPRLRNLVAGLPAAGQAKALKTLTANPGLLADAAHLGISQRGSLYYVNCPCRKPALGQAAAPAAVRAPSWSAASIPVTNSAAYAYSSRPGAPNTIYLDFDGEAVSGTEWNEDPDGTGPETATTTFNAVAFSMDGDLANFSDTEQDAIYLIWQRVAEDYRVFNVNVTTVRPTPAGVLGGPRIAWALITQSRNGGVDCPAPDAGGVAYIDGFGDANLAPAWAYYNNLPLGGPPQEDYIAEVISHEVGHNMSLRHDGTAADEYYPGHGSPLSWGPIMGASYDMVMTQWSKCEFTGARNGYYNTGGTWVTIPTQDDILIITGKLGLVPDVLDGPLTSSTTLTSGPGGVRTITPFDATIYSELDADIYSFNCAGGAATFTVSPKTVTSLGFITPATSGANLDVQADILDAGMNVIFSHAPTDNINATVAGTLPAPGTYYLRIRPSGNRNPLNDGYSAYGSIGQYRVSGTIPPSPPGSIQLATSVVTEMEGSGGARILNLTVSRSAGAGGAVTVNYATSNLSATAGSDYTAASGTLSWADGDPLSQTIAVTIDGDTNEESDEAFTMTLSAPTGGATLGATSITMVALRNDDGASAALAASSAASIQANGTGDSGSCGAGAITGLLLGFGGLGLLRRRRR